MQRPWGERALEVRRERSGRLESEAGAREAREGTSQILWDDAVCIWLILPAPLIAPLPESPDGRWSASHALDQAEGKLRNRTTSPTPRPESTALAPPRARWAVVSAGTPRRGRGEEWIRPWHVRTPSLPGPPPPSPTSWALGSSHYQAGKPPGC